METILVTGGCGFIGSNFIKYVSQVNSDYKIINVDSLTYSGSRSNVSFIDKNSNYFFANCDIRYKDKLNKVFNKYNPDYVINFAAESHVDRSITNPSIFVETNILGTQNLIDLSIKYEIKKYIQISTDEVYGDLSLSDPPFTETTPLNPSSPYSASKAASDFLVLSARRTFGFPCVITRCSNNYGPHQFPEKLIPVIIKNALNGKKIPIYGHGKNIRDWIHVKDHCEGVWIALLNGKIGEVYNFGGGYEITNIDLARMIIQSMDKSESLIDFVTDRPGHDYRYAIDFSKSKRELGWEPNIDFEEGLRDTISWYKENLSKYE